MRASRATTSRQSRNLSAISIPFQIQTPRASLFKPIVVRLVFPHIHAVGRDKEHYCVVNRPLVHINHTVPLKYRLRGQRFFRGVLRNAKIPSHRIPNTVEFYVVNIKLVVRFTGEKRKLCLYRGFFQASVCGLSNICRSQRARGARTLFYQIRAHAPPSNFSAPFTGFPSSPRISIFKWT